MFERPALGSKALLVSLDFGDIDFVENAAEFAELVKSAGMTVVGQVTGKRQRPDPAYFAGSGKTEEIAASANEVAADLVLFNHSLSPAQQRNLEKTLEKRVVDRNELILIIFSLRAQSHEGKLQVELAQLNHASTRLVRGWTHLERQQGGIGTRGGPGEKQIELDRRMISERVKLLKDRLGKIQKQRAVRRRSRHRGGAFTVSIVGYTNAGKSTLFNRLTHAQTYAADQLFATLDTTARKLFLGPDNQAVLTDTVGFIRDLPHTLVAAFRATLEETVHADLLLHVVDASHAMRERQIEEVNHVLQEIQAQDIPQILVFNKIDRTERAAGIERDECGNIAAVSISALTGQGLEQLRQALQEYMPTIQQEADLNEQ